MPRSTNGFAAMQRRLPHKALLRREAPFHKVDSDELEAACRRIADGAEYLIYGGSRGTEIDCRVICFRTAGQAQDMQAWIAGSGIETRAPPMPFPGPQLKVGGG
mgnify:FL=1|jgi:hypothetical protein